ncbi:hypothetical protein DFA_07579 [Cavenderia fasciculata]|uniref:Uncharacterized protein n=1 Tax=Cavenderia fasciculata TaxID=261658 RepID=F4PWU1_CACFS|nr:uncharacterized protein DFA_07579 [Cavenderia fasciculata]EGG20455.1 hypothetical protein DFA_07579 [Cavenderia fasciculata]|eukprot:XP_004367438.1 hypothetical protein DFA_07579 [Cavenderia fasciculata]
MKQRKKSQIQSYANNNNNEDNDSDDDDVTLFNKEETTSTTTTTTRMNTTNNVNTKHVTKRSKNSDNSVDSISDKIDSTSSQNDTKKRSSSYRINNNNNNNNNNKRIQDEKDKQGNNELKSKQKKDLLLICQELGIEASMKETKDEIIEKILKIQNDQLEFKRKMVDNNPLCDYNKGSLEYSLPWPIISKILDLVWTESSICTCYYNDEATRKFLMYALILNQESLDHLNNQYCPIKKPKVVTLYGSEDDLDLGSQSTMIFNSVEKLKLENINIKPPNNKIISKIFNNNIKSMTPIYLLNSNITDSNTFKPFLLGFNNLTSINLLYYRGIFTKSDLFLDVLAKSPRLVGGLVKILIPKDWCKSHITLDTKLANSILTSNILPPQQMINLQTFHINHMMVGYNLDDLKLTKIVDHTRDSYFLLPNIKTIPKTITTIKFKTASDPNFIIESTFGQLNIKKLLFDSAYEMTEIMINSFAKRGYEYHGSTFKTRSTSTRQFKFIKSTTRNIPEIIIVDNKTTTKIESPQNNCYNNPTLPFYLIENIVRYSWNSYYCTCEIETSDDESDNIPTLEQCLQLIKAKSICPIHKDRSPHLGDFITKPLLQRINRLRFGLSITCKRLFGFVSKHLVKRMIFSNNLHDIPSLHLHFSNQYCLVGKSIETLTLEFKNSMALQHPNILQLGHYSNVSRLKLVESPEQSRSKIPDFYSTLFNSILAFKSLTELDVSDFPVYNTSYIYNGIDRNLIKGLKDIALVKLYYFNHRIGVVFPKYQDRADNECPLSQSLESVSINTYYLQDISKCLFQLTKLRHLRIINNNNNNNNRDANNDKLLESTKLPNGIQKISTDDPIIVTKISQIQNPQINQLTILSNDQPYEYVFDYNNIQRIVIKSSVLDSHPFISYQNNYQFIGTFVTKQTHSNIGTLKWVYIKRTNDNPNK